MNYRFAGVRSHWEVIALVVVSFVCLHAARLRAEDVRQTASIPVSSTGTASIPIGTIKNTAELPSGMAPVDSLYLNYFLKTDEAVTRIYQDKWTYQEMQVPFAATSWQHQHITLGTMDSPYEGDVRHDFASQVLRLRVDAAIKEYFKSSEAAHDFKRAQATVNQIKNVPIKIGGNTSHPGEFRFGYDVLTDASKFEYSQGALLAGIYHPTLVSALVGAKPGFSNLAMRVSGSVHRDLPSASLGYQPGTKILETSLSKALSPTVGTRLVSATPTSAGAAPCRYTFEVTYRF